eukprot:TRINITY_DN7853_c0_g1_i1.p1 TRINITY_DN7853_c0_g1~~TRINITY_DN7853_c0_g1_i1.p1  ORF type:complete len:234 (-),score=40.25 TRINITY_DN7853_c0_g1_i1:130-798(-)
MTTKQKPKTISELAEALQTKAPKIKISAKTAGGLYDLTAKYLATGESEKLASAGLKAVLLDWLKQYFGKKKVEDITLTLPSSWEDFWKGLLQLPDKITITAAQASTVYSALVAFYKFSDSTKLVFTTAQEVAIWALKQYTGQDDLEKIELTKKKGAGVQGRQTLQICAPARGAKSHLIQKAIAADALGKSQWREHSMGRVHFAAANTGITNGSAWDAIHLEL